MQVLLLNRIQNTFLRKLYYFFPPKKRNRFFFYRSRLVKRNSGQKQQHFSGKLLNTFWYLRQKKEALFFKDSRRNSITSGPISEPNSSTHVIEIQTIFEDDLHERIPSGIKPFLAPEKISLRQERSGTGNTSDTSKHILWWLGLNHLMLTMNEQSCSSFFSNPSG